MKPKIYLWCVPLSYSSDVAGYAMAEDGAGLAGHMSSNKMWAQHDMGLTSDWKHDFYKSHYPDGYELVWLDNPLDDDGFNQAYQKNQESVKNETTRR